MIKNVSSNDSLVIHYYRADAQYQNWAIWLWEFPQGSGKQYEFDGKDSFGVTLTLKLSNFSKDVTSNNLGLIIKSKDSWKCKDGGKDRKIEFSKLSKDKSGIYHIFIKSGDDEMYANEKLDKIYSFVYAKFIDFKTIEVKTFDEFIEYKIFKDDSAIGGANFDSPVKLIRFQLPDNEEALFGSSYRAEVKLFKKGTIVSEIVSFSPLFNTEKFNKKYNYDGELGAIIDNDSTTFKVWSPISKKIVLRVYKSGTPKSYDSKKGNDEIIHEVEMTKNENGVFSSKISRNLQGFYYTYVVTNDVYQEKEIIDLYAKSSGINGQRGMIVDVSKVNPLGFENIKPLKINPRHLTIYEAHICDITSSKTWTNDPEIRKLEKTFLGACKEGTTYYENGKTVKTGFDHIKELGVNAVQILPVFDHSNDEGNMTYNWGYNPVNYNIIEGGYSSDPFDGFKRIIEFKTFVKKYNEAGINIIMDVVYNHINGVPGSNFDVLMPGYYFRYNPDGSLSNASGCGNETASDMPMMRKFMVDSVCFLAKEYRLAGFRFDLMALHDMETMELIVNKLREINENIVVYGEPWAGGKSVLPFEKAAVKENGNKFKGYGFFNDTMRDALVRESCAQIYSGWCINMTSEDRRDQASIANSICGATCGICDPNKVLNFASCHDNRTIIDKIHFAGVKNEKDAKRMAILANSIILTSNGMSFILSGEEFLRSKGGCENSYNAPYNINELDYSLKVKHFDMFKIFQKLINLKQTVSDLALDKDQNMLLYVDTNSPNVISYDLDDLDNNRKYKVFHLNGLNIGTAYFADLKGYNLYLDTINQNKELTSSTMLIPFETLIAYKDL